jgi:hypothetical protein
VSSLFKQIKKLILNGKVRISEHGYDELMDDDLSARELIDSIYTSTLVEEYPNYPKGPCLLLLQRDRKDSPVHAVWGIPKDKQEPAVLVTAYRPDPLKWENDYIRRKKV